MRRLACAACLLGLVAGAIALPAHGSPARPVRGPHLPALHAEPDAVRGGRIVDALGREVLLRGVNINANVDYWRGTAFPTTFPFTAADAERMAGIGWNSARLLVSWSRVEPRPGHYDETLPRRDRGRRPPARPAPDLLHHRLPPGRLGAHARRAGRGEVCPPGISRRSAGTGHPVGPPSTAAPRAACPAASASSARPCAPPSSAFWDDAPGPGGVGIRTRYARMVGHVAGRFARSSSVAGYDVMNEPNAFGAAAGGRPVGPVRPIVASGPAG